MEFRTKIRTLNTGDPSVLALMRQLEQVQDETKAALAVLEKAVGDLQKAASALDGRLEALEAQASAPETA